MHGLRRGEPLHLDFELSVNRICMMVMCTSYFVFGSNHFWEFLAQNVDIHVKGVTFLYPQILNH